MASRFARLPPLGSLLVFEAAGRLLNFSGAAAELGMTQPAVSHRIGTLEARLGVPLFRRLHRGVTLTAAGAQLLDAVAQGLSTIEDATAALRRRSGPRTLHLLTDFGFAAWWLMPRLSRWSERAPEVEVRIVTSQQSVDLRREDVDIAVLFGNGSWPGSRATPWFLETVYPVCSPAFAQQHQAADLAALRGLALLHLGRSDPPRWLSWADYLEARRIAPGSRRRDLTFSNYQLVLQAALLGEGVALGWRPLVDDLVRSQQVVCLSETAVRTERGYFIVEPGVRLSSPVVGEFRRWLLQEREADIARWPP